MSILVEDDVTWTHFATCLSPCDKWKGLKKKQYSTLSRSWRDALPLSRRRGVDIFPRTGNENVVVRIDASNLNVNQRVSMNSFCRPAKSLAQWVFRRWQLMDVDGTNRMQCKGNHQKWLIRNLGFWGVLFFLKKILRKLHVDSIFSPGFGTDEITWCLDRCTGLSKMGSHVQHYNFSLFCHLENYTSHSQHIPSPGN